MAATAPLTEAELDSAFETSPEFGVQCLDSDFRKRIFQHIKRVGRGFINEHDMPDVYQETVIGVLERARRPDFDPCRSLRMVLTIARNKATDFLRQRGHLINLDEDAILDVVAADTRGSDLLSQWQLRLMPAERRELREILLAFIPTLPERQRIVAQCFIDNFEYFRKRDTYRPLAEAVSAITHTTESVATVKNDWRYARDKIIEELHRCGYTYITVE